MDYSNLIDGLKDKGLDVAEDVAKEVIAIVFDFAEQAIKDSENKIDDLALGALPMIKEFLLDVADKIDGEEG